MTLATETSVFETIAAYKKWRGGLRSTGPKPLLGMVPTMGALHEGHRQLIKESVQSCQHTLVSIFVNPLQFGPNEDYDRYPRSFPADLEMCRSLGVDAIINPSVSEFYPDGTDDTTRVRPPVKLNDKLESIFRPHFFEGVATVVAKLFGVAEPTLAFFGEKDYQQLTIVKKMVRDLNMPLEIRPVATVRESDGLALSSRNAYLTPDERKQAPILYRTLCAVRDDVAAGLSVAESLERGRKTLANVPNLSLQYLEACHPDTLEPAHGAPMVVLVAARLGAVRLIDNLIVR